MLTVKFSLVKKTNAKTLTKVALKIRISTSNTWNSFVIDMIVLTTFQTYFMNISLRKIFAIMSAIQHSPNSLSRQNLEKANEKILGLFKTTLNLVGTFEDCFVKSFRYGEFPLWWVSIMVSFPLWWVFIMVSFPLWWVFWFSKVMSLKLMNSKSR